MFKKYLFDIPLWNKQYSLFQTPYRIGGNSNIYLLKNDSNVCKIINKKKGQKELYGLFKTKDTTISPVIEDIFYNDQNDKYYIIMNRYTNDLLDILANKYSTLNLKQSFTLSYILTKKINQLHSLSVVHRDIKPENILLNCKDYKLDYNSVCLNDYDACCNIYQTDSFLLKYGTKIYAPPEKKNKIYNYIRGDIYSFGLTNCLLYTSGVHNVEYFLRNSKSVLSSIIYELIMEHNIYLHNKSKYITHLCNLIVSMIDKDPLKRPSLNTILNYYNQYDYYIFNNDIKQTIYQKGTL